MNRFGCWLFAIAACGSQKAKAGMTPAEQQRITDLVRATQTKADAYSKAREDGLRTAWRDLDPAATTSPCGATLPTLPLIRGDDKDVAKAEREALDVARWRMTVVSGSALLGEPPPLDEKSIDKIARQVATKGPRRDQFDRQSDMLVRIANEGNVPSSFKDVDAIVALANELGSDEYWGWELNIVTSEHRPPLFNPEGFAPGAIAGKALLWSFKDGRVICTSSVTATNQDSMTLRIDPNEQRSQEHLVLNEDLKNQAYRAAISTLRAVPAS